MATNKGHKYGTRSGSRPGGQKNEVRDRPSTSSESQAGKAANSPILENDWYDEVEKERTDLYTLSNDIAEKVAGLTKKMENVEKDVGEKYRSVMKSFEQAETNRLTTSKNLKEEREQLILWQKDHDVFWDNTDFNLDLVLKKVEDLKDEVKVKDKALEQITEKVKAMEETLTSMKNELDKSRSVSDLVKTQGVEIENLRAEIRTLKIQRDANSVQTGKRKNQRPLPPGYAPVQTNKQSDMTPGRVNTQEHRENNSDMLDESYENNERQYDGPWITSTGRKRNRPAPKTKTRGGEVNKQAPKRREWSEETDLLVRPKSEDLAPRLDIEVCKALQDTGDDFVKCTVKGVRTGLTIVMCPERQVKDKVQETLLKDERFDVSPPTRRRGQLVITGVDPTLEGEDLIMLLCMGNGIPYDPGEIKTSRLSKDERKATWKIYSDNGEVLERLENLRQTHCGGRRVLIRKNAYVVRCNKCLRPGHIARVCTDQTEEAKCRKCFKVHKTDEEECIPPETCFLCEESNMRNRTRYDTKHKPWSKDCSRIGWEKTKLFHRPLH